jgi:hypothetical protein
VYLEQENKVILPLLPLEIWAPCKARWVWAGAVIFSSATCSLQIAEASAATLSQQEISTSADARRGRVNISGFICTVASESLRVFVPLAPTAQNLGVGLRRPFRGLFRGQMLLGAMSRIAPPQPHEVMARIAPRFLVPQPNGKQQNFARPQLQAST